MDIPHTGIHIIGHRNYEKAVKKDIYVASSAEKIQLFLNGTSIGWGKRSYRFPVTFPQVLWRAGKLEARDYEKQEKLCSAHFLETINELVGLKPTVMRLPRGWKADGQDLVLVEVEVIDKSYHISCKTQEIISAKADANSLDAPKSYDDNERTAWVNDDKLHAAWIEFTLRTPSKVDEIELKLHGFRTKMYPIIIYIDDHIVFHRKTDRSPRYLTADCKQQVVPR